MIIRKKPKNTTGRMKTSVYLTTDSLALLDRLSREKYKSHSEILNEGLHYYAELAPRVKEIFREVAQKLNAETREELRKILQERG
jgi:hypothetical protein